MILRITLIFIAFIFPLSVSSASAQVSSMGSIAEKAINLSSLASKHRIIFLGETNHGVSEQYNAISSFSETLFAKHNFKLLQSESSFFKTYVEILRNGKPSVKSLSMIYKDSDEFSSFMDFAQSNELLHAGFDPQLIITAEDISLIANQFDISLQQKEILQAGMEDLNNDIVPHNAFLGLCMDLIEKNKNRPLQHQLLKNIVWANEIKVKTDHLSEDKFKASHSNYRDLAMAKNFLFWDSYFELKRTIVIGASAHLSYGFDQIENEELRSFVPMGKIIKESISSADIVNIALSVKNGESRALNDNTTFTFPDVTNVLEYGHQRYPILLSTDSLQHHASLILGVEVAFGNWSEVFDYILVFEDVKPISHRIDKLRNKEHEASRSATFILKDEQSGKAIDFAHIYFPEKGEGTTTNNEGLFVIKDSKKYVGDEMTISRIGYLSKTIAFATDEQDSVTILLTPNLQLLEEVVVSSEALTPVAIMQKVRNRLSTMEYKPQLNFYHIVSEISDNKDSLQNETIVQLMYEPNKGFDPDKGTGSVDVLTGKKLNKSLYKKFRDQLSYPFIGVTWPHPTALRFFNFGPKELSKFFNLNVEQSGIDNLMKINFKALDKSRRVTGIAKVMDYEGTIWIDEDTYLPIKIDFFVNSEFGGRFYFSTDLEVKNNTMVIVFSQHTHAFVSNEDVDGQIVLKETNTWLKQEFLKQGDFVPHSSHDMTLIVPEQKIWDRFNEFIR